MTVRELITRLGYTVDDSALNTYRTQLRGVARDAQQLASDMRNWGRELTLKVSAPIAGLALGAVKASADMETLTTDFGTLLGSMDAGKKKAEELRQFANVTPFGASDVSEATKTMMQFGVTSENSMKMLSQLGDVSMGNANRLKGLALVYGQVTAAGKIQGGDLLQFISNGFNPLMEISKMTGTSMATLRKGMEQGLISSEMVTKAIEHATSKGGLFFEGMTNGSKTFWGVWSTFKDSIVGLLMEFGDIMLPFLKESTKLLTLLANEMGKMDKSTKMVIMTLAGLLALVGPLMLGLSGLLRVVGFLGVSLSSQGAFGFLKSLMGMNLSTILFGFGKWLLIAGAIYLVLQDIFTWVNGGKSVTGMLLGDYRTAIDAYKATWRELSGFFKELFDSDFQKLSERFTKWRDTFKEVANGYDIGMFELAYERQQELARKGMTNSVNYKYPMGAGSKGKEYEAWVKANHPTTKVGNVTINVNGAGNPKAVANEVSASITNLARRYQSKEETPIMMRGVK